MQTITFIGNGNMALSIAKGLKESYKIEVVGRSFEKLEKNHYSDTTNNNKKICK